MAQIHKVKLPAGKTRKFQALKQLAKKRHDAWKEQPRDENGRWAKTGSGKLTVDQRKRGAQLAIARLKQKAAKLQPIDDWGGEERIFHLTRRLDGNFYLIDREKGINHMIRRPQAIEHELGGTTAAPRSITKKQFDLLTGPDLTKKSARVKAAEAKITKKLPNLSVNFAGFDDDVAEIVAKQMLMLADEFPDAARNLKYLGTTHPDRDGEWLDAFGNNRVKPDGDFNWGNGNGVYFSRQRYLFINPYSHGNLELGNQALERSQRGGWHPQTKGISGVEEVLIHEFGHSSQNCSQILHKAI